MTTSTHPYYQESGSITPGRLALGLLLIIAVSFIMAYVYSLIMYYSPLVYINAIVCAGFGFILGLTANAAGRIAHLRSLGWRIGFGALAGILGYLFHWLAYLPAIFNEGAVSPMDYAGNLSMFTEPGATFELINLINTIGVWEIFGFSNSGAFGGLVWLIEAVLIIGIPVFLTFGAKIHPYSEKQGVFYDKYSILDGYGLGSPARFTQEVTTNGFAAFENLEPPSPRLKYTFDLYFLDGEQRHYIDVYRVAHVTDKDGKESEESTLVIDNLALDTETARRLKTEFKNKKEGLSMF